MNYYNDNDPRAAAWLRRLIADGHLPPGDVDQRSITDVNPDDLAPYDQCHFFAGIGGWPLALRWAGLENARGIWTGSCPCQPLSCAGKRQGHADERHLWPAFHALIAQRLPATIFGEQVASADGREWLAGIRLDLEDLGYACGAADLCAAGLGAPHRRQRLYWGARRLDDAEGARRGVLDPAHDREADAQVNTLADAGAGAANGQRPGFNRVADSTGQQKHKEQQRPAADEGERCADPPCGCRASGPLAHPAGGQRQQLGGPQGNGIQRPSDDSATGFMADPTGARHPGAGTVAGNDGDGKDQDAHGKRCVGQPADGGGLDHAAPVGRQPDAPNGCQHGAGDCPPESRGISGDRRLCGGMGNAASRGCGVGGDAPQPRRGGHPERPGWAGCRLILCRDGKTRRIPAQPALFPLADGLPGRVGLLRGAGNAIVPQVAEAFIRAWLAATADTAKRNTP